MIGIPACDGRQCRRRARDVVGMGWAGRGSHLVLPNVSMAEFLTDQHLGWHVHLTCHALCQPVLIECFNKTRPTRNSDAE